MIPLFLHVSSTDNDQHLPLLRLPSAAPSPPHHPPPPRPPRSPRSTGSGARSPSSATVYRRAERGVHRHGRRKGRADRWARPQTGQCVRPCNAHVGDEIKLRSGVADPSLPVCPVQRCRVHRGVVGHGLSQRYQQRRRLEVRLCHRHVFHAHHATQAVPPPSSSARASTWWPVTAVGTGSRVDMYDIEMNAWTENALPDIPEHGRNDTGTAVMKNGYICVAASRRDGGSAGFPRP